MSIVFASLAGLLFGIGLIAAGMTDPAKVLAFLDITGEWDPSLGLVMAGAIGVGSIAFAIARRRKTAWSGVPIELPERRGIDRRLVGGALLFGAGWGWVGLCPGAALVAAAGGYAPAIVFIPAMLVGMTLHDQFLRSRAQP
jgi:uncharacterized membrane protein YedE/YeeE